MDTQNLASILTSKKALACFVAIAVPVANRVFSLGLDSETEQMIVQPLLVYIVGQGVSDMGKHKPVNSPLK